MKKLLLYFYLFLSHQILAQLPNTDIWVLDITVMKDSVSLTNPVNITNRPGYDNQPAFSPDGSYILFTSIRDEKQSDIYKYDLKTKQTTQFTKTETSEYSPTFMPDGKNISVVMVEPDSTQRLWKFPLKGGKPSLIMEKVDSIGYHCWINKDSLALVMITEPPTLSVADLRSKQIKLFANNVSRCVIPIPDGHGFYYMDKSDQKKDEWVLKRSTVNYSDISVSAENFKFPEDSQDFNIRNYGKMQFVFAGIKTDMICTALTQTFFSRTPLNKLGMKITRIAISPDGSKMAVVLESMDAH
jgi:dipeptidyl aminopeptidase/acylaminoacyl peptidase